MEKTISDTKLFNQLMQHPDDHQLQLQLLHKWSPEMHQWARTIATEFDSADDLYQEAILETILLIHRRAKSKQASTVGGMKQYVQRHLKRITKHNVQHNGGPHQASISRPAIKQQVASKIDPQPIDSDYRLDVAIMRKYLVSALQRVTSQHHWPALRQLIMLWQYGFIGVKVDANIVNPDDEHIRQWSYHLVDDDLTHQPIATEFAIDAIKRDDINLLIGYSRNYPKIVTDETLTELRQLNDDGINSFRVTANEVIKDVPNRYLTFKY